MGRGNSMMIGIPKGSDWTKRRKSLQVRVRDMYIGSDHPVAVQSMTNTDTSDVNTTVAQIIALYKAAKQEKKNSGDELEQSLITLRNQKLYELVQKLGLKS